MEERYSYRITKRIAQFHFHHRWYLRFGTIHFLPRSSLSELSTHRKRELTRSPSPSMADWSRLPNELLQLISEKLNFSEIYIIRFRSVCSSWRSSIPNYPHNHSPLKLPIFPYSKEIYRPSQTILYKHNIFLIKPPITPHHHQQQTHTSCLIRIGPNLNGKTQLWHPLSIHQPPFNFPYHVLDFNQLPVFDLGEELYIHDTDSLQNNRYIHLEKVVVVATCQGRQSLAFRTDNCSAGVPFGVPMVLGCGADGWTRIPTMSTSLLGDMCIFKGRPCVADNNGHTVMIGPDSSVHLLANAVFGGYIKFLVKSEHELLLVDCNGIDAGDDDVSIDVFRLDEKEKKWVKLTNLGDRVLFLGEDCSFSASASELCVANGNCVIYSRDYASHGLYSMESGMLDSMESGMRIFHLDQGRVSPLSGYPDYFKLFWSPSDWIVGLQK